MAVRGFFPEKAVPLGAAFLFLAVAGCATLDSVDASDRVMARASQRGWQPIPIPAGNFRLTAYLPMPARQAESLTVYIEGDGAPWLTPYHPPGDPTPLKPVGLALALADPAPAVAYLARPCQYLEDEARAACDSAYWTGRRFAPEVVAAYQDAVDSLKTRFGAQRLQLVGYSGGGVIAALLAARRPDVSRWATVASPLSLAEWADYHGISPLADSLDPGAESTPLPPGLHFAGANDKIVPPSLLDHFVQHRGGRVVVLPGFSHDCCWTRVWPDLSRSAFP